MLSPLRGLATTVSGSKQEMPLHTIFIEALPDYLDMLDTYIYYPLHLVHLVHLVLGDLIYALAISIKPFKTYIGCTSSLYLRYARTLPR